MTRTLINSAALSLVLAGTGYLSTPAHALLNAKCTTTIVKADGTTTTIVIEGTRCTSTPEGGCTCS